jgi:hypothetical protein
LSSALESPRLRSTILSFAVASMRKAGILPPLAPAQFACAGSMPSAPSGAATRSASLAAKLQISSRGHWAPGLRARQRLGHARAARVQQHFVAAGAHLHAQRAVTLEACGQLARQRSGVKAVGQRAAEQLLARLTRAR